jgi:hypothetical protein
MNNKKKKQGLKLSVEENIRQEWINPAEPVALSGSLILIGQQKEKKELTYSIVRFSSLSPIATFSARVLPMISSALSIIGFMCAI